MKIVDNRAAPVQLKLGEVAQGAVFVYRDGTFIKCCATGICVDLQSGSIVNLHGEVTVTPVKAVLHVNNR